MVDYRNVFDMILLSNWLGLWNTLTAPLQKGKTPPYECPGYDTKDSDGDVPVMPEWGALLLPGPLLPGVVAPDRAISLV